MVPAIENARTIRDSTPPGRAPTTAEAGSACEWRAEFMVVEIALDLCALYAVARIDG